MTPEQEERLVAAFERFAEALDFLAGSVETIAKTAEKTYAKQYPAKQRNVKATVTHVKTDEERLKEEQGQSDENLRDWTTLEEKEEPGPREKAWLESHPESEKKV
jgi:DNA-binding ferritin-like protein